MSRYHLVSTEDDLLMVMRGEIGATGENIGRVLSRRDGDAIVAEMRRLEKGGDTALRDKILSAVNDAVEECFDG